MATEKLTDPVLGDGDLFFGKGERAWGSFKKEFGPTKSGVIILASVVNGVVPDHQRDLYREIESWYPKGVQEVFEAIRLEAEDDARLQKWLPPDYVPNRHHLEALRSWLPPDQIANRLKLIVINIRSPFRPPAKCILEYQFDCNAPVWFVRISEDFHAEWCGLGD